MALNIPMPNIVGSISGFGNDIIKQLMAQRTLQQKAEHEKAVLEQLENHFQENLKLSKAAAGRAAQAAADAHKKMDPMYDINRYQALEDWYKSRASGQQGEQSGGNQQENPSFLPPASIPGGDNSANPGVSYDGPGVITSGSPFVGRAGYKPPAQVATQQPQMPPSQNPGGLTGADLDLMRKFPALRGLHKKIFGIDPLGEEHALQGVAREAYDLERFKNMLPGGENNPLYKQALQAYNAKLHAQEDLSAVRGRTLGGLKTGERWLTDPKTGETIGKETPLTATERNEYKGRGFFNYTFPSITGGLAPVSGEGSISRFTDAASKYGRDPAATKLIDDFLLGKKLLTAGTVKEAATLATGKQKATYEQLRDSLDSSDIPKRIESIIKQFGLPASAAQKADKRFAQILNDATKAGERSIPAFQKQYFDPSLQVAESSNPDNSKYNDSDLVVVEGPNGEEVMTYAKAKSLGAM